MVRREVQKRARRCQTETVDGSWDSPAGLPRYLAEYVDILWLVCELRCLLSAGEAAATCSAGTTSTTGLLGDTRNTRNRYVHINLNEAASCNGTVYGWSYCFQPFNDDRTQELAIAMYRPDQSSGTYSLVEGSYYELTIDSNNVDLITCRNISLQPSERFAVQENDVVGFCEDMDTLLYFERSGSSLWRWNAGGCSESSVSSSGGLSRRNDRTFLMSALIGKKHK